MLQLGLDCTGCAMLLFLKILSLLSFLSVTALRSSLPVSALLNLLIITMSCLNTSAPNAEFFPNMRLEL